MLCVQGQGGPGAGGAHRVALPGPQDLPRRPEPHVRAHSRRTLCKLNPSSPTRASCSRSRLMRPM